MFFFHFGKQNLGIIVILLLFWSSRTNYPPSKFYEKPEFLINIIPLMDEVPKNFYLKETPNMIFYTSSGFVFTSSRHFLPISYTRFSGIENMAEVVGAHDVILKTNHLGVHKLWRVNYLTGEVITSITIDESIKKLNVHYLGVATLSSTKILLYSEQLVAGSSRTFTANQIVDFFVSPSEDKIFALQSNKLLTYSLTSLGDTPLELDLSGYDCKELKDDLSTGYIYVTGIELSSGKFFFKQILKKTSAEAHIMVSDFTGFKLSAFFPNNVLILTSNDYLQSYDRKSKNLHTSLPNSGFETIDENLILPQYFDLETNIILTNPNKKIYQTVSMQNSKYIWDYVRYIWSPKILVKGYGERQYYFYYQTGTGSHKILIDISGKTLETQEPDLSGECFEIVPLPQPNSYIAFMQNEVLVYRNGARTILNIPYPGEIPIVSHLYKSKKSIYYGGDNTIITINWGENPPTFVSSSCRGLSRILAVINDEREFVSADTNRQSLNFYRISDFTLLGTIVVSINSVTIVKIKCPLYPGGLVNQVAVLFSDNTIVFYLTTTRTYHYLYDFKTKTSIGVLDFEFFNNDNKFAIFFLKETGSLGLRNSNLEIWDYASHSLIETVDDYPFSQGRFFVDHFSLSFIGKSMIYHFLHFDVKCLGNHRQDPLRKLCIPSCPDGSPYRVLSKDTCVAVCPLEMSGDDVSESIKSKLGDYICIEKKSSVAKDNCQLSFGSRCLKCSQDYLRTSSSIGFLDSCTPKENCAEDQLGNPQDFSGFGICHAYVGTIRYCVESNAGECTKCIPNFLKARGLYDSDTITKFCITCPVVFMDRADDEMHYIFPTNFKGDGTDVCQIRSYADANVKRCLYYQYKGCIYPATSYSLIDDDYNGVLEATDNCPAFITQGFCNSISRLVVGCIQYASSIYCQTCLGDDVYKFPFSTHADSVNNLCYNCHQDCKTCSGPGPNSCDSCTQTSSKKWYYDVFKSCTSACPPESFAFDPIKNTCKTCPLRCFTCLDETKCNSCKGNFLR